MPLRRSKTVPKRKRGEQSRYGSQSSSIEQRYAPDMDWLASHSLALTLAVSPGQVRSLIEHPASMTHAALPPADQAKAGIDPGGVRLSIGLEDPNDLIADLRAALARV